MEKEIQFQPSLSISRQELLYLVLSSFFCVILISSNLITSKLFHAPFFPSIALPCGIITYPLTFVLSDLVTELFGLRRAKLMIYIGFVMTLLTQGIIQMAIWLPAAEASQQAAFESTFGFSFVAIVSSLTAYLTGQILDVYLYTWCRLWTKGKYLWLSNNVSTMLSQIVDTAVVNLLLLHWGMGISLYAVSQVIFIDYLYKIACSSASTPLFYLGVAAGRRYMQEVKEGAKKWALT